MLSAASSLVAANWLERPYDLEQKKAGYLKIKMHRKQLQLRKRLSPGI
jgi:hypothetical protein